MHPAITATYALGVHGELDAAGIGVGHCDVVVPLADAYFRVAERSSAQPDPGLAGLAVAVSGS